uniref:Membrane-associated phosphatidylinositol transfer protein 3 n=1 Tax=Scleropages formosus TaxID=113540 RepID=A0A8C9TB65_SCLFO
MQNIAQESMDSSDEEFFDARDVLEGKSAILLGMSQWNSNDLVEQIETLSHMDQSQGTEWSAVHVTEGGLTLSRESIWLETEMKCKTHVLILVVHGGNILDTAGGGLGSKADDTGTLASVLEKVARAHFQAAAEHMLIKLVPCPAVCAEAFSLVSNLNPYSYDESCVSSSVDHLPLAALPLLAIASPHYQDAVATVIARANQVYHAFLQSPDGLGFTGQVCLIGDCVGGIYNLFYPSDPSASRLEPLLHPHFHRLPPFAMPRYQRYPLGDGRSALIADSIHGHPEVFSEEGPSPKEDEPGGDGPRRASLTSVSSGMSTCSVGFLISTFWWGTKRLDYALYCPDVLTSFPTVALPHLFHTSYWESTDVVAFVLRQVMRCDCLKAQEADNSDSAPFSPSSPREKWLRRRTHVKLRNVTSNHRVNDVIATEDGPQTLVGRFMYGPLDMVTLTGEKVDILVMSQPQSGRWVHFDTEVTSSSGRVTYTIPQSKRLGVGVYPVRMVVKGDQTSAEAYLTVLPRSMECVVFSIDGSFAASVSIMGSDPKVRPGAVDVVRHWQDLGYLIIYITGRPDMQKQRVVSWLSQHNFPQGAVFFSEGLVHDPLRQKTIFLRNLIQECHIKISAAYGSMKDISVYNMLGLGPSQIYIVGRPSKKYQNQCQFLSEGYAAHLSSLQFGHRTRPKKSPSVRMVLRKGSFGLSAKPDFLCKRTHLRRTMSVQQPDPPCTPNPKPERAQSQPESDKDHGGGGGALSVWGRGSMHRGDTTP